MKIKKMISSKQTFWATALLSVLPTVEGSLRKMSVYIIFFFTYFCQKHQKQKKVKNTKSNNINPVAMNHVHISTYFVYIVHER